MSVKSEQFLSPHLRTSNTLTKKITTEVRKPSSMAPPPFQSPAPRRKVTETPRDVFYADRDTRIEMTLGESVMAVSAFLQAADTALVSAARYENQGEQEKADRLYARSVCLESLAERTAKAARNSG